MSMILGALFGFFINSAQQVYVGIYGLGALFPAAFAPWRAAWRSAPS